MRIQILLMQNCFTELVVAPFFDAGGDTTATCDVAASLRGGMRPHSAGSR